MCSVDFKDLIVKCLDSSKVGSLNGKEKALIALSGAIDVHCSHCIEQIKSIASELGATEAEIFEAETIGRKMKETCGRVRGLPVSITQ